MNLKKLWEAMAYKSRQWPWGKSLDYITARQAQDRLDEVCWPEGWCVEYKEIAGNLFAWVTIFTTNWPITKWDAGSESNIEKEKGHISDSFKRACVAWGIGRFLYPESNATVVPKEKFTKKQFKEIVEAFNEWGADLANATYTDLKEDYDVAEIKDKLHKLSSIYKDNQAISEEDMENVWKDKEALIKEIKW